MKYTAAIRELGYPSRQALVKWYKEFQIDGKLHRDFVNSCCYGRRNSRNYSKIQLEFFKKREKNEDCIEMGSRSSHFGKCYSVYTNVNLLTC